MKIIEIKIKSEYEGYRKEGAWEYQAWKCVLINGKKRMTVNYRMGIALNGEPKVQDVLRCVCLDATSYFENDFLINFIEEFGYQDPETGKIIYNECKKVYDKLTKFLGDDYEEIVNCDEDELMRFVDREAFVKWRLDQL